MTRKENLKNCTDSLIEVTKDLEPIAVEHRRVAKVVAASTVGLSERQLADQLALSRNNRDKQIYEQSWASLMITLCILPECASRVRMRVSDGLTRKTGAYFATWR